jgi:hypothetical protein
MEAMQYAKWLSIRSNYWNGPEYIYGRGEWRAGNGSIVTQWHPTKAAATKEFFKLLHEQFVKTLVSH